jgi:UDP-glucose 4-epimerase
MSGDRTMVTGATGFIGRHVVTQFLAERRNLLLVVRDIKLCPADWRQQPQIEIAEVPDLAQTPQISNLMAQTETVIHLAGLAHVAGADRKGMQDQFMRANARSTAILTNAALSTGVRTFVHLSSLASITGNSTYETINDQTNGEPTSSYGRSKREAEHHVRRLQEAGIFAVSLRPPLVVGAKAKGNWASLQALAASGIPLPFAAIDNRRSLVSVQTLTEAISISSNGNWSALQSGDYCIAEPETISLSDIIRTLREGMGKSSRLFSCPSTLFDLLGRVTRRRRQMAGLTGDLVVDASRFLKTFDYRPSLPLRSAISRSGSEYLRSAR